MKTIEMSVRFVFEVHDDTDITSELPYLSVDNDVAGNNIVSIIGEDSIPIDATIIEYETMLVNEI